MNTDDKTTKAAGFFTSLFSGWGVPGGIARILAGAVIGALAALAALTQGGCTASYTQTEGCIHFDGGLALPVDNTRNK